MSTKFPKGLLNAVRPGAITAVPAGHLRGQVDLARSSAAAACGNQQALAAQGRAGQDAGPVGMGPAPDRVRSPGGDLVSQLLHPDAFTTVERLYRSLPEDGMFSPAISHRNPFQFELGAFVVPDASHLWLSDYSFGNLLFDGINPGDYSEAPPGRFSGSMGFDVQVGSARASNIEYQLDPVAITTNRQAFNAKPTGAPFDPAFGGTGRRAAFDRAASNSFATTASSGLATLPARRQVQGPDNRNPWTWVVQGGQRVALRCVIFRPIQQPIAAIFGRLAGHLLHESMSQALIQRVRPS